jgi:hypothetical protein
MQFKKIACLIMSLCFAGTSFEMYAEIKDWVKPIVVGTYAVACLYGYFKWYKPYQKEVATPYTECRKTVAYPKTLPVKELTSFVEEAAKKFSVTISEPKRSGYSRGQEYYDGMVCKRDDKYTQDVKFQGKFTCGVLNLNSSVECNIDTNNTEEAIYNKMSVRFSSCSAQPWLKKIGYAYGFAGLGVLAFCGLSK